ncbi:MAG: hypothetical protein GXP55_05180 [Deltaproteobacteria bacterium]|nr:hypothetical protein [Deltaproteobacteria bacterium]
MQYTIRNIPEALDRALRGRAAREGLSLNQVAIRALLSACGLEATARRQRDLSDMAGSWQEDVDVDAALESQRAIDPDLWR